MKLLQIELLIRVLSWHWLYQLQFSPHLNRDDEYVHVDLNLDMTELAHSMCLCAIYVLCSGLYYSPIHRTHLGVFQFSLPTQKATLKRKSIQGDKEVVIKAPEVDSNDRDSVEASQIHLLREAVVLAQIRHPNVVQLHGLIMEENKVGSHRLGSCVCLKGSSLVYMYELRA